ncbi:hypothetical protein ACFY1J_45865 [Streptomyces sp. NPDC001406]|uniref:hypothetical protein n=1 Tax=Streptomyces sp. NPDC001406 TaxID=3364572 RepID=UPI0036A78F6E
MYHRRALLHLHGDGHRSGLTQNITTWALASAWRGITLYPIHGPAVVTGRAQDGEAATLDDDLAQHAHAVAQTVRETLGEWHTRPPASNEAALNELLAYTARDVAPQRVRGWAHVGEKKTEQPVSSCSRHTGAGVIPAR